MNYDQFIKDFNKHDPALFKVCAFNLLDNYITKKRLEQQAKLITRVNADVLCLSECQYNFADYLDGYDLIGRIESHRQHTLLLLKESYEATIVDDIELPYCGTYLALVSTKYGHIIIGAVHFRGMYFNLGIRHQNGKEFHALSLVILICYQIMNTLTMRIQCLMMYILLWIRNIKRSQQDLKHIQATLQPILNQNTINVMTEFISIIVKHDR
jgi:hypothetical protein